MVKQWQVWPGEVVNDPFLEIFELRLDEALINIFQWKVSLPMAGGLDKVAFKGLFQYKQIDDSTIL